MQDIIIERCIICRNAHSTTVLSVEDHLVSKETFTLKSCDSCGFRFIGDPPPPQSSGKYYETEEYVEHSDDASGLVNTIYHRARKWMLAFKARMLAREKKKKKILDFGTGTGYFLNHMQKKGYRVTGVEISSKAQSFGEDNFGLEIFHPDDIYEADFDRDFGYITFWHVLEHIYDVDAVMGRVYDLLADDGSLVVALPNYRCLEECVYGSYWNGYDVPRHLWHFSKDQFIAFAENHRFKVRRTAILPLDPFYNCLISESYRKKKWMLIFIPIIGLSSLIWGFFNHSRASSIVYFLEKDHA